MIIIKQLAITTAMLIIILISYTNDSSKKATSLNKTDADNNSNYTPKTISQIACPKNYSRALSERNSFSTYLQSLPLKKENVVYYYNGQIKPNQTANYAVVDISVGNRDLQQCADAVMRLRAEYLYGLNAFDKIKFTDNDGKMYQFAPPYTGVNFNSYLNLVFGMCGSASLAKQLVPKPDINDLQIGDVWIRGGYPGHAVIVVDVAVNNRGNKIFMLAQSYMPAQNIHILTNPNSTDITPWYGISDVGASLQTAQYTFSNNELMTWE